MPNSKDMINNCHVCGLDQGFEPWGVDGQTPIFDICSCCGVTFGYQDFKLEGVKKFRNNWIAKGMPWFDSKEKPENWSWEEQKKGIPPEFR